MQNDKMSEPLLVGSHGSLQADARQVERTAHSSLQKKVAAPRSQRDSSVGIVPSVAVVSSWDDVFRRCGFSREIAERYSQLFAENDMPPPDSPMTRSFFDNEFLKEMGVTVAGHRGLILAAFRSSTAVPLLEAGDPTLTRSRLEIYYPHPSDGSNEASERYGTRVSDLPDRPIHSPPSQSLETSIVRSYTDVPRETPRSTGWHLRYLPSETVTATEFQSAANGSVRQFVWIDIVGRDVMRHNYRRKLAEVCKRYDFSESLLVDTDLTLALPQVIASPQADSQFLIILRVATDSTDIEEDSLHLLTNRWMVAINLANRTVATIHRVDSLQFARLRAGWDSQFSKLSLSVFLCKVFDDSLAQYVTALHESEFLLDYYESVMLSPAVAQSTRKQHQDVKAKSLKGANSSKSGNILESGHTPEQFGLLSAQSRRNLAPILQQTALSKERMNELLYHLHRRCSVYSRMLTLAQAALEEAYTSLSLATPEYAEQMSRSCSELALKAESLHDNCQNLLNLHLSLVQFRTNELMGVLTTFSAFFIPITFIAAVYGMNFSNMPELKLEYGYYYCLSGMAVVAVLVLAFFKKKGLM